MKIAYNPKLAEPLKVAPSGDYLNAITFDLAAHNIYTRGELFKGTDTTYEVFKKATQNAVGYNGLVPAPSYTDKSVRFLREDGTWNIPHQRPIKLGGGDFITEEDYDKPLDIHSGDFISITHDDITGKITISSTLEFEGNFDGTVPVAFTKAKVGSSELKATVNTTLSFAEGTGISLTPNTTTNTILVAAPVFKGATTTLDGAIGIVPQPKKANIISYLRGDGIWRDLTTDLIIALTGYSNNYTLTLNVVNLTTNDTLNQALAKLEHKANKGVYAYDWVISVTTEDTDLYINKWLEIVDFLNKVDNSEGADITDEFVTRKTDLSITGMKTFEAATIINNTLTVGDDITISSGGNIDRFITFDTASTQSWRIGYLGTGSRDANYLAFQSTKTLTAADGWHDMLKIGCETGNAVLAGLLTAKNFVSGDGVNDFSAGTVKLDVLNIPTSNGGTTFGPGSNGQVLKSNGTTVYWGSDNNSSITISDPDAGNAITDLSASKHTITVTRGNFAQASSVIFTPANGELTPSDVLGITGEWSIRKGTWNYAGNGYIKAGSFGNIDLAGTSVLTFGSSSAYTQLYITAPSQSGHSGKTNEIFFYNNHGADYNPGWTRVITNRNYTDYVNTTNFPGLDKVGTITEVAAGAGLSGGGTSGKVTITNAGVRSVTIGTGDNANKVAVNTNGTTAYLTIPYATTASLLNNTSVSDPSKAASGLNVKWYSTISQASGYAGNNYGFPVSNNANGILWLGTHSGPYGGQLGISSDKRLYYRFISNNTFPTTANGGSWNKIAWVSDIPTKTSQLTNDSDFITQTAADKRYVNIEGDTMTGLLTLGSDSYNKTIKWANTDYPSASAIAFMGADGDWVVRSTYTSDSNTADLRFNKSTLKIDGNIALHTGNSSVSGGGSTWGSSITVKINGTSKTLTIPSNPNTDTKNTAGSTNSTNKLFLIGAMSQETSSLTYSNSSVFTQSGSLYATHFYESSDINLKTNIETINTSDNIPLLKSFNWKSDGSIGYGLIAQELEAMGYSELVSEEDGSKTVNYSAALSLIVGKLQVKIRELEKEIEQLKNK